MTEATVTKQVSEIVRWYVRNNRLPKQAAACKNERKLANWLRYMKQKAQGSKKNRPLTATDVSQLQRIPGWTHQHYARSENTGTRCAKKGWEAYIQIRGTKYYGPARPTRTLARADYLKLRAAADGGWATFATTFNALRPDRPLLDLYN